MKHCTDTRAFVAGTQYLGGVPLPDPNNPDAYQPAICAGKGWRRLDLTPSWCGDAEHDGCAPQGSEAPAFDAFLSLDGARVLSYSPPAQNGGPRTVSINFS